MNLWYLIALCMACSIHPALIQLDHINIFGEEEQLRRPYSKGK
jgi:hypothetical protein